MSRLARSQKGNVVAIVAAAIIPLAALIGGGLDMGRAYMARARMQQACDAAALAGRRAMTTSSMTAANITEARKFFDFNFPQGTFQAATFTPVIRSKPGETPTVQVTASRWSGRPRSGLVMQTISPTRRRRTPPRYRSPMLRVTWYASHKASAPPTVPA